MDFASIIKKRNCLFSSTLPGCIEGDESKDEKEKFYRAGRIVTLFELVEDGKLSYEQVGEFLDWHMEDVMDMYQGYRDSQNMQVEE